MDRSTRRPRSASPTRPNKGVPVEQLLEKLDRLERYKSEEEKSRKKDDMQKRKDIAAAKKKLIREISQTKGHIRKRNMEAGRLRQSLQKLERQQMDSSQKKHLTAQKMEEAISKYEEKHNQTEVDLQEKIGQVSEANGLLAYLEYAQEMLEQGVILGSDPRALMSFTEADARNGHEHGDVSLSSAEASPLAAELAELKVRYEEADEERLKLRSQLEEVMSAEGDKSNSKSQGEEMAVQLEQLREENAELRRQNEELQAAVAAAAMAGSKLDGSTAISSRTLIPSAVRRSVTPGRNTLGMTASAAAPTFPGYASLTAATQQFPTAPAAPPESILQQPTHAWPAAMPGRERVGITTPRPCFGSGSLPTSVAPGDTTVPASRSSSVMRATSPTGVPQSYIALPASEGGSAAMTAVPPNTARIGVTPAPVFGGVLNLQSRQGSGMLPQSQTMPLRTSVPSRLLSAPSGSLGPPTVVTSTGDATAPAAASSRSASRVSSFVPPVVQGQAPASTTTSLSVAVPKEPIAVAAVAHPTSLMPSIAAGCSVQPSSTATGLHFRDAVAKVTASALREFREKRNSVS
eukprot:TRINITY_DN80226_c0_g1_i1.p1 TRINITY_DN80226_c0_g1~~TRINITY_DN80226_c0_g1_i1.p1  ORF type:complete len:587 (-),score=117.18 TRINITY_DN80226_c0_g1_i1:21-1748(-)